MVSLNAELKKIKKGLILTLVDAKKYTDTSSKIVKYLNKVKKIPGIYVTVNKPYKTIKNILLKEKINTNSLIFIDAISRISEKEQAKIDDCIFLGTPEDLTGISISITEAVKSLPIKEKFLFFDSLSTLLLYNSSGSVSKFAHFLTSKMREWNIIGVIMLLEKESDNKLISQISQFCDQTIDLGIKKKK